MALIVCPKPLDEIPDENITDKLARDLWLEVSRPHQAGSRTGRFTLSNIMVDGDGCPGWSTSAAELAATGRQLAIDTAELVTSLAGRVGLTVRSAARCPRSAVTASPPPCRCCQPLALSASTRRRIKGQDALLKRTREAAIAASATRPTPTSPSFSACARGRS